MNALDRQDELRKIMSDQLGIFRANKEETQESFCKKYDLTLRTYKKWEGKESLPSWELIVYLADKMKVSLDYFAKRDTTEKAALFTLREMGLSEQAIQVIMDEQNRKDIIQLSNILEHPKFHKLVQAMAFLIQED